MPPPSPPRRASTQPDPLEKQPQLKRAWTAHVLDVPDQENHLSGWRLRAAILALNWANLMTWLDSMATSAIMSSLSKDLNAGDSIA